MEFKKDKVGIVFKYSYGFYLRAKELGYKPKYFIIGYCLFYEMYNYADVEGLSFWRHAAHDERLFGIPVKINKNDEWAISLELEEFTYDFKKEFKKRKE